MPNIRTTYGWETPASRATTSVLVPAYPVRAKARVAASSTWARRSSAFIRGIGAAFWADMVDMLSVDYLESSN